MSPTQGTLHHLEGAELCRERCGAMGPIRLEVWSWSMRATRRPKALDSATRGTMASHCLFVERMMQKIVKEIGSKPVSSNVPVGVPCL